MSTLQMAVEPPAARSGRGNSFLMSALRFAGYDLDLRPKTPTSQTSSSRASAVSPEQRYMRTLPPNVEPSRALLEGYSGIPAEEVDKHVYQMRDRLWDVYPYACVGRFRFISLEFAADAYYQLALFRLLQARGSPSNEGNGNRDGETCLLDVGCCVGQVLRKLVFDGVDPSQLYGTDLDSRLVNIGYDLFRDRDRFEGHFAIGDLLRRGNDNADELSQFDGKMTLVHATSFFHLFTWSDQVRAAIRILRFLQSNRQDVMIFGRQVGTMLPRDNGKAGSDKVYLHNAGSWQRLWDEVGELTGTRWRTTMEPTERIETGAGVESALRKMSFCVFKA